MPESDAPGSDPNPTPPATPRRQRLDGQALLLIWLLVIGGGLWMVADLEWPVRRLGGAGLIVLLISAVVGGVAAWWFRDRRYRLLRARTAWWTWAILFGVAASFLTFAAWRDQRFGGPVWHDEQVYVIQARMLLAGQPAVQPPAEAPGLLRFFDSNHLLTSPTYAGKYPPGTALLYAPAVLVGDALAAVTGGGRATRAGVLETWSILTTAVAATLAGWLGHRWAGLFGLLVASGLVLATSEVQSMSAMVMSHTLMLPLAAGAVVAFVRWREALLVGGPVVRWSLAAGACVGGLLAARPMDGLTWGIPLAIAAAVALAQGGRGRRIAATVPATGMLVPFALLVGWFNFAATGDALTLPYSVYEATATPEAAVARAAELADLPADEARAAEPVIRDLDPKRLDLLIGYTLRKRALFATFDAPAELWGFVIWAFGNTLLPHNLLLVLIPASLALPARRRHPRTWPLALAIVMALVIYAKFPHVDKRYLLPALPAVAVMLPAGVRAVQRVLPAPMASALGAAVLALIGWGLADLPPPPTDGRPFDQTIHDANAAFDRVAERSAERGESAVIFFRYHPGRTDVHLDPVFNVDAANPLLAKVVRANDLGNANAELLEYLGKRRSSLAVYTYDQTLPRGGRLRALGPAASILAALRERNWSDLRNAED